MRPFLTLRCCAPVILAISVTLLAHVARAASPAGAPGPTMRLERYPVSGTGGWDFLTLDPAGERLFISRSNRVQVWSTRSKQLVAEIADTPGVHGIALAPELNRGFTSNGRANTLSVFALDSLKVTGTVAIDGDNPDAILYEPVFKRVYAFNGRSRNVTVIDAVSLAVVTTVSLGGKLEVAVADPAGRVFVNIEDTGEIVVIDPGTEHVQARWSLKPCTEPTGLAIDTAHQRLFAVCANRKMVVVDATNGRLVAEIPIGTEPDGVEFDAASGQAFSANGEGTVTVVRESDPEHFQMVATIATQPRARTLALDRVAHRIYLVSASFGPTPAANSAQPRPRPPMLADTFTVLVLVPR